MKKIILTLLLLTYLGSYSQLGNITNIIPINGNNHYNEATALTVPSGKIWAIHISSFTDDPTVVTISAKPKGFDNFKTMKCNNLDTTFPFYLIGETKVYVASSGLINILEYDAPSTQTGVLALNEIKSIENKLELFPNPTNHRITLNTEKKYVIEVYDMRGQIVMKANGNTVDLSNLSNSVYILKVYNELEKTSESYKVVKK
ncbi:MAG TPA: T9SS type A sorting domain-containing protein [Flavobacterium sp.]|nr:T9SS type A sorting domain-containing protein [Flavobacterium sp.]